MDSFLKLYETLVEKKGVFYHISPEDLGAEVEFTPRRPVRALPEEPDTPRICVSPSIAGCLVAGVSDPSDWSEFFVYSTEADAIPAEGVFDSVVTEEHWILEPTVFYRIGRIDTGKIPFEAIQYMGEVQMPYEIPSEDEIDTEEGSSYEYHCIAKEIIEDAMGDIFDKLKRGKSSVKSKPKHAVDQGEPEDDFEEEPEEGEVEEKAIPSVPAPGNFHQVMRRKKRRR